MSLEPNLPNGAKPTLERTMSPFSSFAISMSTICILAGGITSFPVGFCSVGGAAIGIGWPLEMGFALIVAATMAHLASAFPTAGGTYHWSYTLGGRGWGWMTACFSLAGLITALAAVNVGLCRFVIGASSRMGDYDPDNVYPEVQHAAVIVMTFVQALINHRGIKLTSWLNDFSGYWIMAVAALLTLLMLICSFDTGLDFSRLIEFRNYSGLPAGNEPVFARTANLSWLFALGLLMPAYTLTGFDAAAQTSEETKDAARVVPRGIVRAVLVSGLVGWIMLSSIVLAAPDLDDAASKGLQSFFRIVRESATPYWTHFPIYLGLGVGQFLCGLAIVTSVSRMAFAFARDGGLPFSTYLRRISPQRHTPSVAIWTVAALAVLCATLSYTAIASACAIFIYLSYIMPITAGLWAHGRTWTRMGPWQLGRFYRPLALLCILGCTLLIFIGMHPPNEIARWVVGGSALVLVCLWFSYKRKHFPGPSEEILLQLKLAEAGVSNAIPNDRSDSKALELEEKDMLENVHTVLKHVPALKDRVPTAITKLRGGLTNTIYKVEYGNDAYVVRLFGADTERLGIDREREHAVASAVAAAGVAPEVAAYLPKGTVPEIDNFQGASVVHFVVGKLLDEEDARKPEILQRIAATLKTCHAAHAGEDLGEPFSVFAMCRQYVVDCKRLGVTLPASLDESMKLMDRIEKEVATNEPPCLCHNDLLAGNFIDDGTTMRVIDWEYGGLGDRYFDLGNFAGSLQMNEEQERQLLTAYFGAATPDALRRLKRLRLASDMRDATWSYLQAALSKLNSPESYMKRGDEYLARFQHAANTIDSN